MPWHGHEHVSIWRGVVVEPPEVVRARELVRAWELRDGHCPDVETIRSGNAGEVYRPRCWDCDWRGPEMSDRQQARKEALMHKRGTIAIRWR